MILMIVIGVILMVIIIGLGTFARQSGRTDRVESRQSEKSSRTLSRQQERTCRTAVRKSRKGGYIPSYC